MKMYHSKTPAEVLAEEVGIMRAYELLAALGAAGWIVVCHDAIRLAQAHEREACRYEAANDNRKAAA
jgi:hypothetical protein